MSEMFIIILCFCYLILLFAIAYWGERRAKSGHSLVNNPYVFAFSLTVYCTAWTYYGSVGRAAQHGIDFLTIYIGPTVLMPIWWIVMRKIIRICKAKHITSIADFISSRYGNSSLLGVVVTIVCLLGVTPYIALQLKAISASLLTLTDTRLLGLETGQTVLFTDSAFYMMLFLALFTVLFGTRNIEATERHEGMVTAIAFESIVKLLAFILVGVFVTYGVFGGVQDIFQQAVRLPELNRLFTMEEPQSYVRWFCLCLVSMLAFMFLPRQFQVAVVENVNRKHLTKAAWLFPLYLLIINIFVLPIALGGTLLFPQGNVNSDTYVLAIPLSQGQHFFAILAFLGGFSAATSMIIVSTTALSVMMSNNLIMPILVNIPKLKQRYTNQLGKLLLYIRRLSILIILHLAYTYYKILAENIALVSIGLVSFVAVAQFAPAILGGIYWKRANKEGAMMGILSGFAIWFYTLVFPSFATAGVISENIIQAGPWGWAVFRPYALLGLEGMDKISHAFFWSMFFNLLGYVGGSYAFKQTAKGENQAEIFVNIYKYYESYDGAIYWKGTAYIQDLRILLTDFLGKKRTNQAFEDFSKIYGKNWQRSPQADFHLIAYTERLLAGTIGVAAARTMIASVVKDEEEIRIEEVYDILRESQQLILLNQELKEKSIELQKTSDQLKVANQQLQKADDQKNEFISTVTHEMRTPITSIRAFSEILYDNDDLNLEEKRHFLSTIIKETNRMERLINQVLELEKFDSGKQKLNISLLDINATILEATESLRQVIQDKGIHLTLNLPSDLPSVQGDKDRITQVILNLLSNAIKFCDPANPQVKIDSCKVEHMLRVRVYDNGRGIKEEFKNLIFDKFYQAEDQNIRKPKGSGLGLAICKKIIQYHQGEIWVESEENHFSRFCFTVPLALQAQTKVQV